MEGELALAEKTFSGCRGFSGFVIHHFRGYRTWLELRRQAGKGKEGL